LWQLQVSRSAARQPDDGVAAGSGAGTGHLPADETMFGTEPEIDERTKTQQQRHISISLRPTNPSAHLPPMPHA